MNAAVFSENLRFIRVFVFSLLAVFFCALFSSSLISQQLPDFVNAAHKAKLSVVFILIGGETPGEASCYGTATILSTDGYVVTNYHVVRGENTFVAVLPDGTRCAFEKLKANSFYLSDPETDIAVMKLSGGNKFVPVETTPSTSLRVGEWVLAVGNPYGLSSTITSGIVSSFHRSDVGFAEIEDFIQTDVPINPGNSGGPLVNSEGKMVGMNTAIRTTTGGYQGISFAIPSEMVVFVSRELIQYGYVRRGWIGLVVREVGENNVVISVDSVIKGSPAARAGLRKGDRIREANGKVITSRGELTRIIKNFHLNSDLALVIERENDFFVVSIPVIEKKPEE